MEKILSIAQVKRKRVCPPGITAEAGGTSRAAAWDWQFGTDRSLARGENLEHGMPLSSRGAKSDMTDFQSKTRDPLAFSDAPGDNKNMKSPLAEHSKCPPRDHHQ
jgi:hypothetical protein